MAATPRSLAARLLVPLAALAACSRADANDANGEAAAGAENVPVVRNTAQGAWPAEKAWTLSEDLRIGGAEAEGAAAFGRVADVEADPLGRIWVADGQANEIRVFDAAGLHVRTIGRRGAGPGEFTQITGMDWAPDGHLWVLDGGNARFTVLDTAGALVASHPRPGGGPVPWRGGFDAQGRLHDPIMVPGPQGLAEGIVRYDAGMQPRDTLWIPPHKGTYFTGGQGQITVPYSGTRVFALTPAGDVWLGVTDRYRFDRVTFAGDTVGATEKPHTPVRVTEAEVENALAAYRDLEARGTKLDRRLVPAEKPPVNAVFSAPDGTLWVSPTRQRTGPALLDVFDGEGAFLGSVRLPALVANSPTPVIRGDALYGVVRDDYGVESVVRLRIARPR
ncbi:MAG TPA: 6-bladed beta-propeller [Longimicrobium sp.]